MILQGQPGVQNASDGTIATVRMGRQGDLSVSELHGQYYEQCVRGNLFQCQGTAVTTSAGGTGTFTGTLIANPAGSGANLVIGRCTVQQVAVATTAGTAVGIQYGQSALPVTASLTTIVNRKAGGAASVAVATAGATVTAMTSFCIFGGLGTTAVASNAIIPPIMYDFRGGLIIPPGYQIASYTASATTTALLFAFEWEEVPIL